MCNIKSLIEILCNSVILGTGKINITFLKESMFVNFTYKSKHEYDQ